MRAHFLSGLFGILGLGCLFLAGVPASGDEQPPPLPPGIEVQARGPVHEAYAEPVDTNPQPSVLVPKRPPDPVEELPPDQRPEGDNVQWIPGYWSWDNAQNDYVWVSGFWRVLPPDRQWVPGSWEEVQGGWHWVSGYWDSVQQTEIQYLPPPPPSLETAQPVPAPNPNMTYAPGIWVYRDSRYLWRPGFWVAYHPGWVWIPAHYVWTPIGVVFVEGYWDHPICDRGLLFAPVRIDLAFVRRPGWVYTPAYVIQPDFLLTALFIGPRHHHYYFGDYFGERFAQRGYVPWVDYRVGRHSFDPNFVYYKRLYGTNGSWERNLRDLYVARQNGTVPRPPATLVQQTQVVQNITVNRTQNVNVRPGIPITSVQNVTVVTPLKQIHNTQVTGLASLGGVKPHESAPILKLQSVPPASRTQLQQSVVQVRQASQERRQTEARLLSEGAVPVKPTDKPKVVKVETTKPAVTPAPKPPATVTPTPGPRSPGATPTPTPKPPAGTPTPTPNPKPPGATPTPTPKPPGATPTPTPTPKPPATTTPGAPPAAKPFVKVAPPPPTPPKHEDKPIPKDHQPPQPPKPPGK
jgi:hypothetical protein